MLRGHAGFVTQCSYKPHDMSSFEFRDAKHDKRQALFSDEITPLWLLNTTTNKLFTVSALAE